MIKSTMKEINGGIADARGRYDEVKTIKIYVINNINNKGQEIIAWPILSKATVFRVCVKSAFYMCGGNGQTITPTLYGGVLDRERLNFSVPYACGK